MLDINSLMDCNSMHMNMMTQKSCLSNLIFTRPPILLTIGKFLDSTELCLYSRLSKSTHAIWCYHHSPYSKFFITQANNQTKKSFSGTIKCNVTDNGLKFEWKCTKKEYENLLNDYSSDQFIECAPFEEPKTKTKWFIEIFPNGYHLSKQGYGALFLTMEWKPKNIKEVRARLLCNCSQVNLKFSDGVTYDWRKFSKGKHNAFKISDVLANDSITLSVELVIIDVTESETRINSEIKDQIDGMHNKMLHLQSKMDEIDSVQNRLFNIEKMLSKFLVFQSQQQEKQEEFERLFQQRLLAQHRCNHSNSHSHSHSCHHHNNNRTGSPPAAALTKYNNNNNNNNNSNTNLPSLLAGNSCTSSTSTSSSSYSCSCSYDCDDYNINGKKEQEQELNQDRIREKIYQDRMEIMH